jgi:hypothetical protein
MLPYPNNAPSGFSQTPIDESVANLVSIELLLPKGAVVRGQIRMFWAAVPETTIYENSRALMEKDKVGMYGELSTSFGLVSLLSSCGFPPDVAQFAQFYFQMSSPTSNSVLPEKLCQQKLRVAISAPTNTGHDI